MADDVKMEELERYREAWTRNMVTYWKERIDKLRVIDSGRLRQSIVGMVHSGPVTTIDHTFLMYGLYQSRGTGREFGNGYTDAMGRTYKGSRGMSGHLPFMTPGGESYRNENRLDKKRKTGPAWGGKKAGGKARKKRDWFAKKYYSSRMVLNEMEAEMYGKQYQGMLVEAVKEMMTV